MHFDGWQTMEGRHLVYAYATVLLLQFGYAGFVAVQYFRTDEKATKSSPSTTS